MRIHRLTPAMLLAVATACAGRRAAVEPLPASQLRAAPSAIVVDGKQVVLATSLTRDFQPSSPVDGRRLVAVLRVQTGDGSAMPSPVHVDAAWVIDGHEVWASVPRRESAGSSTYHEVVTRDGPRWGPEARVDVVVRLRLADGESRLLLATDQRIQRTN